MIQRLQAETQKSLRILQIISKKLKLILYSFKMYMSRETKQVGLRYSSKIKGQGIATIQSRPGPKN